MSLSPGAPSRVSPPSPSGLATFLLTSPRAAGSPGIRGPLITARVFRLGQQSRAEQTPMLRTSRLCLTAAGPPPPGRRGQAPLWKQGQKPRGEKCVKEESVFWEKRSLELPFRFILGQVCLPIIFREAILRFVNFISQGSKSLPKIGMCPHSGQRAKPRVAFVRTEGPERGSSGLCLLRGWRGLGVRRPPARSPGQR